MSCIIKTSTCGKLVIAGEHSVMHGYSAISMAVNRRVEVLVEIVDEKKISVFSNVYGNVFFQNHEIEDIFIRNKGIREEHKWALPILFLAFKNIKNCGAILKITSNIENVGFGSSGAIFSAVVCGFSLAFDDGKKRYKKELLKQTIDFQQAYIAWLRNYSSENVFMPSGVDLATSIYGGVVLFDGKSKKAVSLPSDLIKQTGMFAIYSGHKTPTYDTIKIADSNKRALEYYRKIDNIVWNICSNMKEFKNKNREEILDEFYENILLNQKILEELNLMDNDIFNIISACKKDNVCAKISGSGLGDCIVAFAKQEDIKNRFKNVSMLSDVYKILNVEIDNKGLKYKIIK